MDDDDPHERSASVALADSSLKFSNGQNGHSLLHHVRGWARSVFFPRHGATVKEALEEAIEEVLEERQDDLSGLKPEETKILRNVLSFGDITVHDIMMPRTDIIAVENDISFAELQLFIDEHRHTRMPVYKESLDHVLGFIHVKDVLSLLVRGEKFEMSKVMREVLFVPPSMRVIDLLVKLRQSNNHMALVVDEYGGTDGLVTLEDVFEEIVGEIQDEHDEDEEHEELIRIGKNAFEADARLRVEKLEEALGISLTEEEEQEEFDTVGGLIFAELGRIPSRGEVVSLDSGIRLEVLDVDPRRIHRVRITQDDLNRAEA